MNAKQITALEAFEQAVEQREKFAAAQESVCDKLLECMQSVHSKAIKAHDEGNADLHEALQREAEALGKALDYARWGFQLVERRLRAQTSTAKVLEALK